MSEDEKATSRLPDEAAAIRAGYMKFKNFEVSTDNHYEHHGEHALSVFCLSDCDEGEEVARCCPDFNRDVFREATVGSIRAVGYNVESNEPPYGHALVKLPSSSREDWQKLNTVFEKAKENPHYEERG